MRLTHVVQIYESYKDFSDYPEGVLRSCLVESYRASKEHAQAFPAAQVEQVGSYIYYRIYKGRR